VGGTKGDVVVRYRYMKIGQPIKDCDDAIIKDYDDAMMRRASYVFDASVMADNMINQSKMLSFTLIVGDVTVTYKDGVKRTYYQDVLASTLFLRSATVEELLKDYEERHKKSTT
jgi:hypothetical protein